MWENQKQLKLSLFREGRKLSCLRTGTSQLSPLLDANLDFFMWHLGRFWALWPVRGALRAGAIFNCSLITLWLLQNSPVLRNDSFLGEKNKESPPLLSVYKKSAPSSLSCSSVLVLHWLKLCHLIFTDYWELSSIPLCSFTFSCFFSIYQQVFLPVHLFRAEFTIVPKICFSNLSAGHAERLWWHQAVPASSSLNWRVNPLQVRLYSPKYLQAGSVFSSLCTASDPWKSRIKICMRDAGIWYKFV